MTWHKLIIDLARSLAALEATILENSVLNGWWLTWWFKLASLWFTLNPLTTLAMEFPDIWPSSRNIVSVALASEGTLINTSIMVLSAGVLSVRAFWHLALLVPLAAAFVPDSAHWIAAHFASGRPQFMVRIALDFTTVHHFTFHIPFALD